MNKNYKPSIKFYPQERNTTKMNLPNKLTLFRIILVPIMVIVSFFDIPGSFLGISTTMWIMELIFIIASITDFLDGYLSRKNNQVTDFGKFLDAIADKILVKSVLIIFAAQGHITTIIPVVIIVRDIIVDAIRMTAAKKGNVQAAKLSGKLKTASLMIGMVLTFFYNLPFELLGINLASAFLYFGMLMSLVSLYEYYKLNKKYIL